MKIKNLVSFGCGWPHGVELGDPANAYPALIAEHYNWTLDDRTTIGATLPGMLADYNDWVTNASLGEQLQSLVLIGLTHETGTTIADEDDVFENVVSEFNEDAALRNIPMLQFNVLARQHKLKFPTLIESSSALEMLVIRDQPRKAPLFTEHKFPNEKGHAIISEFLINKINSVIITDV